MYLKLHAYAQEFHTSFSQLGNHNGVNVARVYCTDGEQENTRQRMYNNEATSLKRPPQHIFC